MIALVETGSRALSPSTNDPGTAIEVVAALQGVFEQGMLVPADPEVQFTSVSIAPPRLEDLLTDGFRPIARDGAGVIEVQTRLQKSLSALAACSPDDHAAIAAEARDALARAKPAMPTEDLRALRSAARRAWS